MSQKAQDVEWISAEVQGEVASKEGNGASLFVSPVGMHKYEGFSAITRTLRGKPVTGRVVIEMVADWL